MWEYVYYVNTQISSCDLGGTPNVLSSQSAQESAIWKAVWFPDIIFFLIFIPDPVRLEVSVCWEKETMLQKSYQLFVGTKCNSSTRLSIHSRQEARNMIQYAHHHLSLIQEEVEGREVIEKIFSCAHKLTHWSSPMSFLQIRSPKICASSLNIKVLHNLRLPCQPHPPSPSRLSLRSRKTNFLLLSWACHFLSLLSFCLHAFPSMWNVLPHFFWWL